MKLNRVVIIVFLFLGFTSCKNNEQERETIDTVETTEEKVTTENADSRINEDVVNAVKSNPELSTFATGLNAWNVEDSLNTIQGEMIIFAPTNLAYSTIRQNTEAGSMIAIEDEELIPYHIITADDDLASLKQQIKNSNDTVSIATVQGEDLKLSLDGNSLILTGATGESARVTDSIQAGNGIVYIIDRVLLPRDTSKEVIISNEG